MNKRDFWRLYNYKESLKLENQSYIKLIILFILIEILSIVGTICFWEVYMFLWLMSFIVALFNPFLVAALISQVIDNNNKIDKIITNYNSDGEINLHE